jgi:hypothetical protein
VQFAQAAAADGQLQWNAPVKVYSVPDGRSLKLMGKLDGKGKMGKVEPGMLVREGSRQKEGGAMMLHLRITRLPAALRQAAQPPQGQQVPVPDPLEEFGLNSGLGELPMDLDPQDVDDLMADLLGGPQAVAGLRHETPLSALSAAELAAVLAPMMRFPQAPNWPAAQDAAPSHPQQQQEQQQQQQPQQAGAQLSTDLPGQAHLEAGAAQQGAAHQAAALAGMELELAELPSLQQQQQQQRQQQEQQPQQVDAHFIAAEATTQMQQQQQGTSQQVRVGSARMGVWEEGRRSQSHPVPLAAVAPCSSCCGRGSPCVQKSKPPNPTARSTSAPV